jgi:DNA-binding IclR family transcriptional regulator
MKLEPGEAPKAVVDRVLHLLSFFEMGQGDVTLSEIARATGMAAPTTFRLLRSLEQAGFVRRDSGRRYHLGPRLVHLGVLALQNLSIHTLARPHLTALVEETQETVGLAIPMDGQALYIDQVPSSQAIQYINWTGRTVPLEGTAIGEACRGQVGSEGYVARRNTIEPDVTAIAAPVYDRTGAIAGAMNVTGPTYRIPDERVALIGQAVVRCAADLSGEMAALNERTHVTK